MSDCVPTGGTMPFLRLVLRPRRIARLGRQASVDVCKGGTGAQACNAGIHLSALPGDG